MDLIEQLQSGSYRALAKAISSIEEGEPLGRTILQRLYSRTGKAHICAITGPPGAGKSCLVQQIALAFRARERRVAIVAVDPSSPFTGGSILADRERMGAALSDPTVFMRSLASRGHLGGISAVTGEVALLFDAFGFDIVLVETVGTGQSEVDVLEVAHSIVVVAVPGLGDEVQTLKAGLMEIADVFALNKADLPHSDIAASDIESSINLSHSGMHGLNRWDGTASDHGTLARAAHLHKRFGSPTAGSESWKPPVVRTSATSGEGIVELVEFLCEHRKFLELSDRWHERRQSSAVQRVRQLVFEGAGRLVMQHAAERGGIERALASMAKGQTDPYTVADEFLKLAFSQQGEPATPLHRHN